MEKYELTSEFIINIFGIKLFRIKSLVAFASVTAGELGGYIEKEENLSQSGNAWLFDNAEAFGNARLFDNAELSDNARLFDDAVVTDNAVVTGAAFVTGAALLTGDAFVSGDAFVTGAAEVLKSTHVLAIGYIGSRDEVTTFFRTKSNLIHVTCGCFDGSLEEFELAVKNTHAGTKHETTYKLAIELAKAQIDLD